MDESQNQFFDKIAILELSGEAKSKIAQLVERDAHPDKLYWTEIILSSLIATFGLLQNSVAVIIGAMLIAPLLRPIQGMAFGIACGRVRDLFRSFKMLFLSVFASVLIGFVFSALLPIKYETAEILSRTTPNLLDLFIAVFSAAVAFLSLSYSRLSESVAGVAMAASLMPPLAVVGIELSFGNFALAWGSLFLFLTNLFAILIVGTLCFFFYGFHPHQKKNAKTTFRESLVLLLSTVLISVPLLSALLDISEKVKLEKHAAYSLGAIIEEINPNVDISQVQISDFTSDSVALKAILKMPENSNFFEDSKAEIQTRLSFELQKAVTMELEIIRTAQIITALPTPSVSDILLPRFREMFGLGFPHLTIIRADFVESNEKVWVKILFSSSPGIFIDQERLKMFEKSFSQQNNIDSDFVWIPIKSQGFDVPVTKEILPETVFDQEIYTKWERFWNEQLSANEGFRNLSIEWVTSVAEENLALSEFVYTPDLVSGLNISFDWWAESALDVDLFAPEISAFLEAEFPNAKLGLNIKHIPQRNIYLEISPNTEKETIDLVRSEIEKEIQ